MQMHPYKTTHPSRLLAGGSLAPALIVLAALGISTAVFFLYTKKRLTAPGSPKTTSTAPVAIKDAATAKSPTPPATPQTTTNTPTAPKPAPAPTFGFARPLDLGKQMAQSLATGDFGTVGKLAAATDATQAAEAAKLFEKMKSLGFTPGSPEQVELLGQVENRTRIAIPLTQAGNSTPLRLQLDLERDERMGWKIAQITLPKEASTLLAAPPAPESKSTPSPTSTTSAATSPSPPSTASTKPKIFAIEEKQDALSFSSDFVKHLLNHDFTSARAFIETDKVPVERLAGLCIVFEEGDYRLKPAKPLLITVANPEVSWVIAQVESESLAQSTEFGLELKRAGSDGTWKVAGLNLSQILGSFAQNAGKLGIPYTPIVKNPRGGESLALYFEYDQAMLHPRARKQIEIIAAIMKADPGKKLSIAGHTDSLGDDDYNVRLSSTRAITVKEQLIALGVPAAQIETTGLGKAQPLGPNQKADGTDDPEGRSRNRRAEIYLNF